MNDRIFFCLQCLLFRGEIKNTLIILVQQIRGHVATGQKRGLWEPHHHTTARNVVKKGEYKKGVLNNGEHVHYSDVLMLVGLLTIIMVLFLKPSFFDTHTEQIREINKKASSSCKGNFCGNKVSGDKTSLIQIVYNEYKFLFISTMWPSKLGLSVSCWRFSIVVLVFCVSD